MLVTVTGRKIAILSRKEPVAQCWPVDPINQDTVYAQHPANVDGALFRNKTPDLKTLFRNDGRQM